MIFPFVAVEGQEKIKKALLLNIINPKIGGVLINGEKGTAKSTLVRGIGEVFPEIKIVNLPLNITEDNLLGSLDIEKTLKTGKKVFQDGLLKKCHNNILYIDEVNLLGDSIISNILEVASREINYIEREGISISHQCKFILIGTMNPEEGGLRPQLLDKFGLYVNVEGSDDILERVKIIKKRLEFENNPRKFCEKYKEDNEALREKIFRAKERLCEIKASEQIINIAIKIVEEANTTGNRAEIILIETAKGLAALDGRKYLNISDLKEAAEFVLPYRTNQKNQSVSKDDRENMENENSEEQENSGNNNELTDRDQKNQEKEENNQEENCNTDDKSEIEEDENIENSQEKKENSSELEEEFKIGDIFKVKDIFLDSVRDNKKRSGTGKRCKTKSGSLQGKYVKSIIPKGKIIDFAFDATIRAAAPCQRKSDINGLKIKIRKEDIRVKVRERRTGTSILFVVDSSGSMGVKKRMEAVKGAILSLLKDAYEKRDRVGLVAFRKDCAEELLPITRSIDLAQKKLEKLTTGGKTPLAAGIERAYNIIKKELKKDEKVVPLILFLSDGKANYSISGKDPIKESLELAQKIKKENIRTIVIDTEEGFIKLEMAKTLSEALGAEYYKLENLKSEDMLKLIKNSI